MVRLSDVFIPNVYGSYTSLNNVENDLLVRSGIIAESALFDELASGGSTQGTIPFWKDIDRSIEPNYSNDDPADMAVPHGVGTGTMKYRKSYLNQSFGSMDLVKELAEADPLQHIKNRFDAYWVARRQMRLLATLQGVFADNIANDAGDMLVDISAAVAPADQLFNGDAFTDAVFTMGDQASKLTAVVAHSNVVSRMSKNDDVETIRDSEGKIILQVYKEKILIMDDSVPVTGTGADRVYTTYIFGNGAFGFAGEEGHAFGLGEAPPATASWMERTEQAGNGGGMEVIGERKTQILHPFGFSWVEEGAALVEFSPTDADLKLAAHWNRVVSRKNVPLAALKSKA